MTTYYARLMDGDTGGEGSYEFEGPDDLMRITADEIVSVFFESAQKNFLSQNIDWELNGVMKNRDRGIVTAIGSLIPEKNGSPIPFLLMISDRTSRS